MIRSRTLAATAGGLAACSSIDGVAANPLPTETFKILRAALAVEAAEAAIASCEGHATVLTLPTQPKTAAEAGAQQRVAYVG